MEDVMSGKHKIQDVFLAVVVLAGFAVPAMADSVNAQPMQEGNVTYISGGIGLDERKALLSSAKNYNLEITNANKAGQFAADTNLVITSKNGREMINIVGVGPLFYASLPIGEYIIQETNGDQHEVRNVKISARKPTDIHMIWKQT